MSVPLVAANSSSKTYLFVALVRRSDVDWHALVHSLRPFASRSRVALVADAGVQLPESVDGVDTIRAVDEDVLFARIVNELIAANTSDFVIIVDAGGRVSPRLVDELDVFIAADPDASVIYADESIAGVVVARPVFSPERLRCQYYLGDLLVFRRGAFDALGGLAEGLPGAELYDLALRASRDALKIGHVPLPLYERSQPVSDLTEVAVQSTRLALEAHLEATGGGAVRSVGIDGIHDTRRLVEGRPLVSIVIPSRGIYSTIDGTRRCYLLEAVRSITELSTYGNVEFVIVLDSVAEPEVIDELNRTLGENLRIVTWREPFNFSDKINHGVVAARGDFVLLLNDDVEVISPDWIESLLALAQRPGAGMVGAMLYYADGTIQHAGHAYYEGDASHIGLDAPRGAAGPLGGFRVEREVSGVTAACALMPTEVFHEVGGLSSLLPGAFNDVDLAMKVTWLGHDIYWTPHAELFHFESKTRDASVHEFEIDITWGRWGFRMHDPRYWPYPHDRRPTNAGDLAW